MKVTMGHTMLGVLAATLAVSPALAEVVTIDNGQVNTIDDATFAADTIVVADAPNGMSTTLYVMPGAEIFQVTATGSSEVYVEDGEIFNLRALDMSTAVISGGRITEDLIATGNAVVNFTGGTVESQIFTSGRTKLRVSGGYALATQLSGARTMISGGRVDFVYTNFGTLEIIGGDIVDLRIQGFAEARLAGGHISGILYATVRGMLSVVGEGFMIDGVSVPFGPVATSGGRLTGVLAAGDAIDNLFLQANSGTMRLLPATPVYIRPGSAANPVALVGYE